MPLPTIDIPRNAYQKSASRIPRQPTFLVCIFPGNAAFKIVVLQGQFAAHSPSIDTTMILSAAELIAAALDDLPADIRSIVQSHYLDGESVRKIQKCRPMKCRDIEAVIAAALEEMRKALKSRGFEGVSDLN